VRHHLLGWMWGGEAWRMSKVGASCKAVRLPDWLCDRTYASIQFTMYLTVHTICPILTSSLTSTIYVFFFLQGVLSLPGLFM
jgi:hypothetical protein